MSTLLDLGTSLATVGAAVFAGWAAVAATKAANASRDLVELEHVRDRAEAEAAFWRQARRVTVAQVAETLTDSSNTNVGVDTNVRVSNASDAPILKVRIKIIGGGEQWGPQLVTASLGPGDHIEVTARLLSRTDFADLNAYVRFADVDGRIWVADARTMVEPDDDESLDPWISEGRDFAQRDLSPEERGTVDGAVPTMPDFDRWRSQFQDG